MENTKIEFKNPNETFWVIFKQYAIFEGRDRFFKDWVYFYDLLV